MEERVAVLESRMKRNEKDVGRLFDFFRAHMEKEEEQNDKFLELIGDINNKLNGQKSFWAGMLFAFTGMGAVIGAAVSWFKATH